MIDPATIKRDAQADIADWPVMIRHYYAGTNFIQLSAGLNDMDDVSALMPGALLDDPDVSIIAIVDDFKVGGVLHLPNNRDRVDLLLRDGVTWKTWEVKRVVGRYDPLNVTIQFILGTPNA